MSFCLLGQGKNTTLGYPCFCDRKNMWTLAPDTPRRLGVGAVEACRVLILD